VFNDGRPCELSAPKVFRAQRGELQMTRLLDHADLHARGIKYSKAQLWRLWNAGKFPRPIKLSTSKNAWDEVEINEWLAAKLAARDGRSVEAV
jgi:prophage regulatory protein